MEHQPYQPAEIRAAERTGESTAGARVLVVDDDPTVAEIVSGYLDRAGYAVDRAGDGAEALARAAAHWPDLVVLDLMLPGMDGLEVCRRMRARGPVPVVMLTARGDEDDRILGLEVGADDYVTKPFSPRELVLRVGSVLRRTRPVTGSRPLRAGGLTADPGARRATKDGAELALTVREFDLLVFFLRHPGRAFGREELMREVWGWDFGDLSTVTVHVRRLRGKVEDDPARPRLIHTVWGVGYRFEGPAHEEPPTAPRPSATDGAVPGTDAGPGADLGLRADVGPGAEGAPRTGSAPRTDAGSRTDSAPRTDTGPYRDGAPRAGGAEGRCSADGSGDAPASQALETPGTDAPASQAVETPGTDAPASQAAEAPGTDAPASQAAEAPGTDAPGSGGLLPHSPTQEP